MTYILLLLIFWLGIFLCGFFIAPFFARYSDTSALSGFKNFIHMHIGLWRLKLECPAELKDSLKHELSERSEQPPTIEQTNRAYFTNIHDKHLWTVLYAYLQQKNINYVNMKAKNTIILYNGRTLSDQQRDIRNIIPFYANERLTNLERKVLASARCGRKELSIVDHAYLQLMQERHGNNTFILPKDREQTAYTIFTYGTENVKRHALHVLQRKRHFVFLNRLIERMNVVEKEQKNI